MDRNVRVAQRAESTLLRYRERNTPNGVTKSTAQKLAEHFGLTETDLLHRLLAQAAARELPQYAADDGALSDEAWRAVTRRAPRQLGPSRGSLLD